MAGLTRQQLSAVVWLRWRLLLSSFRKKGAGGEIVARIILIPVFVLFAAGPIIGAGFAGYYAVAQGKPPWLSIELWIIFLVWQFIGLSASTTGPGFDLSTLTRFPIGYRDYLLVRLSFGLLDPPTLLGGFCLVAMTAGIGFADARLLPWAALVLFVYGLCNVLFSRMLFSWLEKWLAQRRTREIVGALFLLLSFSFQGLYPALRYLGRSGHRTSPALLHLLRSAVTGASILPPGLAGSSIAYMQRTKPLLAIGGMSGVCLYTGAFLAILSVRLLSQYRGENLNESPAARVAKRRVRSSATPAGAGLSLERARTLLPAVVTACLGKELKYLLRSGPLLFSFITPIFMVLIFGSRMYSFGRAGGAGTGLVFSYGCAYLQVFMVAMLYNCFAADGAGVQMYFYAPIRMRDVVLAKNMISTIILATEVALIYIAVCVVSHTPPLSMTFMTVSWVVFTFVVGLTCGNLRSLYAPKKMDESGMKSMKTLPAMSSLISLGVLIVPFVLGWVAILLSRHYGGSIYWVASGGFLLLIAFAVSAYLMVLSRIDSLAARKREEIAAELCRS